MHDVDVDAYAAKAGGIAIQGSAADLHYIVSKSDPKRVAVVAKGTVILTRKQAIALQRELKSIFEEYCEE